MLEAYRSIMETEAVLRQLRSKAFRLGVCLVDAQRNRIIHGGEGRPHQDPG